MTGGVSSDWRVGTGAREGGVNGEWLSGPAKQLSGLEITRLRDSQGGFEGGFSRVVCCAWGYLLLVPCLVRWSGYLMLAASLMSAPPSLVLSGIGVS